jgi:GTPase SAR1 family protein
MVEKRNFKITMLGDSGVGKTCLITKYNKDVFSLNTLTSTHGNVTSKVENVQSLSAT